MSETSAKKEAILFSLLLFAGLAVLPGAVYYIGDAIFGEFGGHGLGGFYGMIFDQLAGGEAAIWFLVLSPYLVWQLCRFTIKAFKLAGSR